jgi:hypothetical protein
MPVQSIRVEGARETRKALRQVGADLRDLTKVHRRIADLVAPVARANVPNTSGRSTGRLAEAIRPRATQTRASISAQLVYAPVIEFGWPGRGIPPALYIGHAMIDTAGEVMDLYREGIAEVLGRYEPA